MSDRGVPRISEICLAAVGNVKDGVCIDGPVTNADPNQSVTFN